MASCSNMNIFLPGVGFRVHSNYLVSLLAVVWFDIFEYVQYIVNMHTRNSLLLSRLSKMDFRGWQTRSSIYTEFSLACLHVAVCCVSVLVCDIQYSVLLVSISNPVESSYDLHSRAQEPMRPLCAATQTLILPSCSQGTPRRGLPRCKSKAATAQLLTSLLSNKTNKETAQLWG